jgi:hypothetical protein
MTNDYFDIVEAVKRHIEKAIYRTVPSHAGKELPKWKKNHSDIDLTEAVGMGTRVFEVSENEDALELIFTCSGVDDYDVSLDIDICYPDNNKIKSVAFGDYTKIKGELMCGTNIELIDLGFGFFKFDEPLLDDSDDEAYRILTIPITARISVGLESTIESWIDGDSGIAVQDT